MTSVIRKLTTSLRTTETRPPGSTPISTVAVSAALRTSNGTCGSNGWASSVSDLTQVALNPVIASSSMIETSRPGAGE